MNPDFLKDCSGYARMMTVDTYVELVFVHMRKEYTVRRNPDYERPKCFLGSLNFPELTEDRRKELVKDIKKKGEGTKVAIRNIRRDANDSIKKMEKSGDISEDELKDSEEKIQKLTDKYVGLVDKAVEAKSKEILTV